MSAYENLKRNLLSHPKRWLITGVAGFIGSNLLETLLNLDQQVIGLDNFSTGYKKNLEQVEALVGPARWKKFQFIEGDIRKLSECKCACHEIDFVLHQAALGSVPRSMLDPISSHDSNVTGFLNMLVAARDAKVKRFVYASSSAIYGDHPELPKVEDKVGKTLSPYAATKKIDEIYAENFTCAYGFPSIGLRYFNVFGPRQDPEGAYAAVIPKWLAASLKREPVLINGDGETSRDFCFVENVVQANLLAATTQNPDALNQAYNIAVGERTTLNELFSLLQSGLRKRDAAMPEQKPVYQDFREGDVRHSLANISKAQRLLGYEPTHQVREGLEAAMDWYKKNIG
jgi:UDP-N-acetylglucosamine/UDP-N-acetylgalactosamine 4-epimerase